MLNEPDPDPGGGSTSPKGVLSHQEVAELKDQNEQQLLLINQLKEMLRKEQSSVSQEKVEEYVNTLSKARAKKIRQKKDESSTSHSGKIVTANIDSNKKERINLLRQQMEENKARLAERGKSQKGIEKMVNEMQAQFKDSQQFNSPLNMSLSEVKNIEYNENSSQKELYNILITKERKITELIARSQKLESTVLDLQENVKEKDSVIDARTKAITLMTDSLSRKGKSTLDNLEETKEQMRKMQENFVALEADMKARQLSLLNDLKLKNLEISDLQEINEKLRNSTQEFVGRTDLEEELSRTKKHNEELLGRINELENHKQELESLKSEEDGILLKKLEESGIQNQELSKKIASLEQDHEQHLLDDLEVKNRLEGSYKEIADILSCVQTELEETKTKLKRYEDEEAETNFREENEKLQKQLQDALAELNMLKSTGKSPKHKEESLEMEKLKKQLDESNKSMIKMRAQQKGKIKELNKKLEQFKKMNDSNALITQLQNENSKLSEKVAELEEEKGNMQLKMVESGGSLKDEKDEEFTSRVTSELSSIHYEEQLEKVETEKQQLKSQLESLKKERDDLLDVVETLKKDKQDINTKLENYIQENMELIDKLEKLSAEKVSSAESIEIVEGLTQQEKIELAAYQKIIGQEEVSKCAEDDTMDPPGELNESVLQLSEDTAELLQKIEMFTRERKEVMQKMDSLKEENNLLHLKVKEIEKNRDMLAETYEQLQNEKDALINEKDDLVAKLGSVCDNTSPGETADVLQLKLKEMQFRYEELSVENSQLKSSIKDLDSKMQEKFNLEEELLVSKRLNIELDDKLKTNIEEIKNYEKIIEENKSELINSSELIADLQNQLQDRDRDINELNSAVNDLTSLISELRNEANSYKLKQSELEEVMSGLSNQLDQAGNREEMKNLEDQVEEMNRRLLESNNELEVKNFEIGKLQKDVQNREEVIRNLQAAIDDKDKSFRKLTEEIKNKYLGLQQQLDTNTDTLQKQVNDLQNKNKEQLEKMKKLAANLKKKTQSYQELEKQFNDEKEKWESEKSEKEATVFSCQQKINDLLNECQSKDNKITSLIDQIQHLEQTNTEQQAYILNLRENQEKLNTDSLQKEMADSLHEEIDNRHTSQQFVKEEKVRELEMLLENKESELHHHIERIEALQRSLSELDEEKSTLEARNSELEEKLDLTSHSFKEKSLLEDQLELKLAEVSATDEALNKKLQEIVNERDELLKKQNDSEELIKKLKIKLKKSHDKVTELKTNQNLLEELETVNAELKKQITSLDGHCRHLQQENDLLQKTIASDYEKMEADYQIQLEELLKAKNDLTVECEKLQEKIGEFESKEEDFLMEIEEYKLRLQDTDTSTDEVNRLKSELEVVTNKLHEALSEITQLSEAMSTLMEEINVLKTAKNNVEGIIQEAVDKVVQKIDSQTQTEPSQEPDQFPRKITQNTDLATFQWPNQPSAFDVPNLPTEPQANVLQHYFADSQHSQIFEPLVQAENIDIISETAPIIDDSKEALLKKIKALEFLLFNADKENVALTQCAEMVTELADMIYEKANIPQESQIQTKSNSTRLSSKKQVKDEVTEDVSKLEGEIMSQEEIDAATSNKKELQTIEYQKVDDSLGEQQHPVIEPVARPQKAYLCYSKDEKQHSLEAFEENDDGWGWGPEEGRLEEEHFTNVEHLPQVRNMQLEMNELRENLKVLQMEREQHLEEIKQLQIKSGKLIKKCKELKLKSEQSGSTAKPDEGGFFDLNETIQEELRQQVQNLEKKLKEVCLELEKEKIEKNNLSKKVDVLASANDRLVEMKEVQDAEVHRWQRKYQEVQEKIDNFEWGNDGFAESKKESTTESALDDTKIQELEQIIRDLTLDNEELQSLLEEHRNRRLEIEKKTGNIPEKEIDTKQMSQELERVKLTNETLEQEVQKLQKSLQEKNEIISQLQENNQESNVAEVQFEQISLQNQIENLNRQLIEREECVNKLSDSVNQITHSKIELENQIETLTEELATKSNMQVHENSKLLDKLKNLESLLEEKEDKIIQLNKVIAELRNEQLLWESTENQLKSMITQKDKNIDELLAEKQRRELENHQSQTEENMSLLEELKKKEEELEKMISQVTENRSLFEDLKHREKEIETLTNQLSDKEVKVTELEQANQHSLIMVNELNASWQVQVDQRGAEVAELWKNHLESVQNDFAATQKKLMFDVSELEERCNILVNENNELRKNVDAEIRNEVDKLSALHQQIANNQQIIASLQITAQEKQKEIENLQNSAISLNQELDGLRSELAEKDKKISSMDVIVETTQKQFDEKRQVVEEIVSVLEKNLSSPLSYEKHDILNEFNKQVRSAQEKDEDISKLNEAVQKLTENSIRKDREITGLNQIIEDLEKDLSVVHEKEAEIARLTSIIDQFVLEKDGLSQELEKLRHEHSNCQTVLTNNIDNLNQLQSTCMSLEEKLHEKEKSIEELNARISEMIEASANDSNKEIERLSSELQQSKLECSYFQQHLAETQNQLQDLTQNLNQKIQDYDLITQQLNYYQQTVALKDEEIRGLQNNLQEKESEFNSALTNVQQYNDLQNYYEQQLNAKDYDIQTLQSQIFELEKDKEEYSAKLEEDRTKFEEKLNEQNKLIDEDTKQMEELKLIIEDQVVKIEELKKELFEKSSRYDGLIAEMDMGRPVPVTHQPVSSQEVTEHVQKYTEDDLSEPVSRAELDLALYMLHQRDVRCEELTVELTQLLEERDTLQLRLSNAIREKEEIRSKLNLDAIQSTTQEPVPGQSTAEPPVSGTEVPSETLGRGSTLATKLTELRTMGYQKDKTLVDEQDARRLQQFSIMQQHIKEASKLPPEAAAKLVNASYTLSRDVQSPSKVLLNWLWGNSTPKAGNES